MLKTAIFVLSTLVAIQAFPQVQVARPAGVDATTCLNYPFCATNSAILSANPVAPAGVDLARCPGYPFCDTNAAHAAQGPALGFPAGVDPTRCPGYPFQPCV